MAVTFACPECQKVLKTSAPAGKKIRCPKCQAVFPIPDEDEDDPRPSSAIKAKPNGAAPARRREAGENGDEDDRPRKAKPKENLVTTRSAPRKPRVEEDEDLDDERDEEDEDDRPRTKKNLRAKEDEDFDDERDGEDEEDRPRRKKKGKKKKKSGSGLLIGLIAGGVGLVLILGFVVTAFVWPGFLKSDKLPPGTGQENLLAFTPLKAEIVVGMNLAIIDAIPDAKQQWEQAMRQAPQMLGQNGLASAPGVTQLVLDSDRFYLAADSAMQNIVLAVVTKKPFDAVKLRKTLNAKTAKTIHGKRCYSLMDGLAYMPNDRLVVLFKLPENEAQAVLNADPAAIAPGKLMTHAQQIGNSFVWGAVSLEGNLKQQLNMLDLLVPPGKNKDLDAILGVAKRAKVASLSIDVTKAKDAKLGLSLDCGDDADALKLKQTATKYRNLLTLGGVAAGFMKDLKDLKEVITELNKALQIDTQGSRFTVALHISEKLSKDLEKDLAKVLPPGAFGPPGGMQGGPGMMPPGMKGMMPPGMKGMMPPGMKGMMPPGMKGMMPPGMKGPPGMMPPGQQPPGGGGGFPPPGGGAPNQPPAKP
jgi:hypothetical protein